MTDDAPTTPARAPADGSGTPVALRVAGTIGALQGAVTVVVGVVVGFHVSGGQLVMGATTALFFAAYGALLVVAGWALWRPRSWARGPVLAGQLVWFGVAWSLHVGSADVLAVVLALSALVCLGALVQRSSIEALDAARPRD